MDQQIYRHNKGKKKMDSATGEMLNKEQTQAYANYLRRHRARNMVGEARGQTYSSHGGQILTASSRRDASLHMPHSRQGCAPPEKAQEDKKEAACQPKGGTRRCNETCCYYYEQANKEKQGGHRHPQSGDRHSGRNNHGHAGGGRSAASSGHGGKPGAPQIEGILAERPSEPTGGRLLGKSLKLDEKIAAGAPG